MLDREHLRELTDGDAEFERELLGCYKNSARNILAELRANLSAGDPAGIAREAHALKGASLSVGAMSMAQCAAEIETAARAGDVRRASEKLDDEERALWVVLEQL